MNDFIPVISVIIPMYNVEKYISECIVSIENQTYKLFEIILIDDGSSDKTYDVAKSLVEKYNNIRLFHQDNKGQAAARNKGLSLASGKYISFIDSDDYIEPDMFEYMLKLAEKHDLDIIECCYNDVFPEKHKQGKTYFLKIDTTKVYSGIEFYDYKVSLSPCDKLYKFSFLKSIDFKCTENHYAEDVYDTTFAILNAKRVMHKNKVVYHYRRDNLGSTRNNTNIDRRIKLGQDKLYIATQLNKLKQDMNINGYIRTIIVRNVAGTKLCPIYIKNKKYRLAINKLYKEYNGIQLINSNISFYIFLDLIRVGIVKLINKGD